MGATHVTVTVRNPAEPDRCWDGLFLVDTGRSIRWFPEIIWSRLDLSRKQSGLTNWRMEVN